MNTMYMLYWGVGPLDGDGLPKTISPKTTLLFSTQEGARREAHRIGGLGSYMKSDPNKPGRLIGKGTPLDRELTLVVELMTVDVGVPAPAT